MRGARKEGGKQWSSIFPFRKIFILNQIDQCSFSGSLKLQKGNLLSHEKFIFSLLWIALPLLTLCYCILILTLPKAKPSVTY